MIYTSSICCVVLSVVTTHIPLLSQLRPGVAPPDVLWQRGDRARIGYIDGMGNFVPNISPRLTDRPAGSGSAPTLIYNLSTHDIEAYEYRDGVLIRGIKTATVFVPESGSRLMAAEAFLGAGKPDRLVYNRPESVANFWTPDRRRQFPGGLPQSPAPTAPSGPPPGWRLVALSAAYPLAFPDGDPLLVRVIHTVMEFGRLNPKGEFVPDYRIPALRRQGIPPLDLLDGSTWHSSFTLPIPGKTDEKVYEYRSGRLLKGMLSDSGVFTPEVGSVVGDFRDYKPGRDARIYNLPGILKADK